MVGGEAQREFLKFTLIGSFLAVVPAFRAVGTHVFERWQSWGGMDEVDGVND